MRIQGKAVAVNIDLLAPSPVAVTEKLAAPPSVVATAWGCWVMGGAEHAEVRQERLGHHEVGVKVRQPPRIGGGEAGFGGHGGLPWMADCTPA